jgi:cell division protein ZapA
MPLVNVMVNGRAYTIACDEGEEEHLRELATVVDSKAREVLGSVGQVGDARLLLMAALLLADENHALSARVQSASAAPPPPAVDESQTLAAESLAAEALEAAAARIESLAAGLVH